MGELMRQPYNWAEDVKKLKMPVMLVYGDSDMIRPEHIVEFYQLLGGGLKDAGWMREHMSQNRLAILPDLTHYEIFVSPKLAPTVLPFLNGESGAKSWAEQVAGRSSAALPDVSSGPGLPPGPSFRCRVRRFRRAPFDVALGRPQRRDRDMLLKDKVAVIYGAGGAVGGATARAFAREGATVFLAGRTEAKLAAVAADIAAAGGRAEVAPVDALDKGSVDRHAAGSWRKAGRIDISFNAIDLGDAQGAALVKIEEGHFALPIVTAMRTHFLTATAAARAMIPAGARRDPRHHRPGGEDAVPRLGRLRRRLRRDRGALPAARGGTRAERHPRRLPPLLGLARCAGRRCGAQHPRGECRRLARGVRGEESPSGPCSGACRVSPRSPTPRRSSPPTRRGRSPRRSPT